MKRAGKLFAHALLSQCQLRCKPAQLKCPSFQFGMTMFQLSMTSAEDLRFRTGCIKDPFRPMTIRVGR